MLFFRSLRTGTALIASLAITVLFLMQLAGCSESETTPNTPQPPVMPAAQQLQFDFSFFEAGAGLEKTDGLYDNFINAYMRTVFLDLTAKLVLAAPVNAFSAALHTVPVAQEDGSWLWTYNWLVGSEQISIILRGLPVGDMVQWQLSLAPGESTDSVLWFSGNTSDEGRQGRWVFHDLDREDYPICGEINWGISGSGNYLEFVSLEEQTNGHRLRFNDNNPQFSIEYTEGVEGDSSYIRWNGNGEGSLLVPEYNDGLEACWGINLQNRVCP